jgi:heptosyltransferase-1
VSFPNFLGVGQNPDDILVVKPSSLGDIVHTLPAVALVKRRWPGARLRWLVNSEWAPLLEGNPHVDEVVIFPRKELRGGRGLLRTVSWARGLRGQVRADLVLDFQGLLRSALISKLCRAEGGHIVGLSDGREGSRCFYDHVVPVGEIDHAVDRYLALVAALGIDISPPLEWLLPAGSAPAGFTGDQSFILLHPFSRGAGKSLAAADVATFCRAVAPRHVVLVGRTDQVVAELENVTNLLNRTTLLELIWLIRRSTFVVSVDSGPVHIAAALTPRLLSIHTWSDPSKVGPYQPESWVWKGGALFQMRHLARSELRQRAAGIAEVARHVASL